ncbi:MAG: Ldh family oxidoreductase [Chloroflexota bacterium]
MPNIQANDLVGLSQAIFEGIGTPSETAQIVAESLVKSNLLGHDSHGVQLVPMYIRRIQQDAIDPLAEPTTARQTAAVSIVDGNWGYGQIVARYGTEVAIQAARQFGIGCVALTQSNHIGRLGEYAQMIAEAGLVGMLVTGLSRSTGIVAPYGGRDRLFGTNPMAWGMPVDDSRPPLIVDFATSGVAYGKVNVAASKGVPLPPGLLLDKDGQPTTDPADVDLSKQDTGALLPFGAHKGSGLMLTIELLTRSLAGFSEINDNSNPAQIGNPTLITAYNIEAFLSQADFQVYVETFLQRVKDNRPAPGFDEVLLPGEPEARTEVERLRDGVPIPETTWSTLLELAESLGVAYNL